MPRTPPHLSEFKAPDGQPEKAHFNRWFEGSQVVDTAGHPLVVFHGTGADIKEFEERVAFFTSDPELASSYAARAGDGGNVVAVYLVFKNPKRLDFLPPNIPSYYERRKQALYNQGHDGIITADGTYMAFWPEQIKSAIGNSGRFAQFDGTLTDLLPPEVKPEPVLCTPPTAAPTPRRRRAP